MKKLPIGMQSFEKLITSEQIYVDKTQHIYNLVRGGNIYFLSRPRRFGKSLLLSTLGELFKGKKNLFEGLYIYDKWNWEEEKNAVIHLDFSELKYSDTLQLDAALEKFLDDTALKFGISFESNAKGLESMKFAELIKKLHKQTGKRVVILVDEYDKPVTDNLHNKEILSVNKRILHDFYQVIKATDGYLRFVLLTGVSKFSGLSVFSALNSVNDITVDKKYAAICGYTQEELENNFKDYISAAARELELSYKETVAAVKDWYNGYSWDGETLVYNPFSTLLLFEKKEFANYWFRTGTPTFLLELIRKHNRPQVFIESLELPDSSFESYDPDNVSEIPLLFQTGYLTVKKRKSSINGVRYTLGFPDKEVRESFLQCLLSCYTSYPSDTISELSGKTLKQFQNADEKGLKDNLTALLAHLPYQIRIESEAYYHSIFLIWLKTIGFNIEGEISTNKGRIDAVLKQDGFVVITEIKYGAGKQLEDMLEAALNQIKDKKYYEKYSDGKIILLGIAFNGIETECRFEKI